MSDEEDSTAQQDKALAHTWPELLDSWFGDTVCAGVDLVGGHYAQESAKINRAAVAEKIKAKLEIRKIQQPKPISPRVLVPAIEALSEESDEHLQDIWANLFTNAMDPSADVDLQKILIETLRQFEPIDTFLLHEIDQIEQGRSDIPERNLEAIANKLGIRSMALALSHERLAHLGCVPVNTSRFSAKVPTARDGEKEYRVRGQHPLFNVTALGFELLRAVRPDEK